MTSRGIGFRFVMVSGFLQWRSVVIVLVGLALITSIGCSSAPEVENIHLNPIFGKIPDPRVTLNPGDEVDIKFYYTPELNETQIIRPDGAISLQLVGDVQVQGKTPVEIAQELKKDFEPHLTDPEVTVIIKKLAERKVFVSGEVKEPGSIELPGNMMALDAIMESGGFLLDTAKLSNVVVIRHKNGMRYGGSLDFSEALEGKPYKPFFLQPNDIVFVPRTGIVNVTTWIDQHINKLIPVGLRYTVSKGNLTYGIDSYNR